MKHGIFYAIGVGPGNPDLITVEAIKCLQQVDVIYVPEEPAHNSYAYQIACRAVPSISKKTVVGYHHPMTKKPEERNFMIRKVVLEIEELLQQNKSVGYLVIGDPTLYATVVYVKEEIAADGHETIYISGVPSFVAAAARLDIPLAKRSEELRILPASYKGETGCTTVYMKAGRELEQLIKQLEKSPGEARGVSCCGMSQEVVATKKEELGKLSGYLTTVIAKEKMTPEHDSTFFANQSCKYYPCHNTTEPLNCLFCYCPMYAYSNCLGNPSWKEKNGKQIKICTNCDFPHRKGNYEKILAFFTQDMIDKKESRY